MRRAEYARYLRSARWSRIRKRVMRRDGWKCRGCGEPATQVHHGSYDEPVLRGADDSKLYSLCRGCHEALTFNALGARRPWLEVQAATRLLGERTRKATPRAPRKAKAKRPRGLAAIRAASLEYAQGLRP